MRQRRRERGLREVRLSVPDPKLETVRESMAAQVSRLDKHDEIEAARWIEAVSEFDAPDPVGR